MREHLYIVRFKICKTFLGKIITSVGCLHSFQGLFYYIVLTLEGYFIVTGIAVAKTTSNPLAHWTARNNYMARYSVTSTERVVYTT